MSCNKHSDENVYGIAGQRGCVDCATPQPKCKWPIKKCVCDNEVHNDTSTAEVQYPGLPTLIDYTPQPNTIQENIRQLVQDYREGTFKHPQDQEGFLDYTVEAITNYILKEIIGDDEQPFLDIKQQAFFTRNQHRQAQRAKLGVDNGQA